MEELFLLRLDLFEKLQGVFRDGARHKVNREAAKIQIEILDGKLQNINESLSHHQEQLLPLRNISNEKKRNCNTGIHKCKIQIATITNHLGRVVNILNSWRARVFPTVVLDILPIIKDELDELNGSLGGLNGIISSLHDGFVVVKNMVPENPSRIFLKFDDATSPEGKLKIAILEKHSDRNTICAVASGMGGVRKTVALRGVDG